VAASKGLQIEKMDNKSKLGGLIFELYIRAKFCTEQEISKMIENVSGSVVVNPPQESR
jgi:hypothetical protein